MQLPGKVAENLLSGASSLAAVLVARKIRLPGPMGKVLNLVNPALVNAAAKLAGDKLREMNAQALARQDHLAAVLTGFRMDLDRAEKDNILYRSLK